MRYLLLIVSFFFIIGCKKHDIKVFKDAAVSFDSIQTKYTSEYILTRFLPNWREFYKKTILVKNPDFSLDLLDSVDFLVIPALNIRALDVDIPVNDLSDVIPYGNLSIKNSLVLVINNQCIVGIFINDRGLNPLSFSPNLKNMNLEALRDAEFFYTVYITSEKAISSIPGIIYYKNNEFNLIYNNGEKMPLSQQYSLLFNSQDKFKRFISKTIETHKKYDEIK